MTQPRFAAVVTRVHAGCTVAVGTRRDALEGDAVIGRAPDADLRLDDPTISGRHVRVTLGERGFTVETLARNGTTFVNGERLGPGRALEVDDDAVWLQLGRVLLHVFPEPVTVSFDEPLAIPDTGLRATETPVFAFRGGSHRLDLWCRGQAVALFPSSVRVLARLCESAGAVVTSDDLDRAVDPEAYPRSGGASLPQLITYIRMMLNDALDAGWLQEDELRAFVAAHGDARDDEGAADRRALLRAFVENVRGVGYRIRLTPAQVAFLP